MKDWMTWGLAGGLLAIIIPLLMGPGLEGTDNIFYFYGIGAKIATKVAPEDLWHITLWTMQFLLGFLIGAGAGYLYGRYKK